LPLEQEVLRDDRSYAAEATELGDRDAEVRQASSRSLMRASA
jgi:hypothetical protein